MRCPDCGFDNPGTMKFCGGCGTELALQCRSCGARNPASFKYCGDCGVSLSTKETGVPDDAAERRQLTVMFCDLVESTELSERFDPEDLREVIREYQRVVTDVVLRYGGSIAQYLGDGMLIYFGYPLAHEDDARRAIMAGVEIVEAVENLEMSILEQNDVRVSVRVGVHTGSVVTGDVGTVHKTEDLAVGSTPNIAARVQGLAQSGTVYFTQSSHDIVGNYFEVEALGAQKLRGVGESVNIYRAIAVARSVSDEARSTVPFVGRARELAMLTSAFELASKGEGQVVQLRGEPGIGKSRLQRKLRQLESHRAHAWVTCRCSAYHQNSAYFAVIDLLLESFLGPASKRTKDDYRRLSAELADVGVADAEKHALLAELLRVPEGAYAALELTPEHKRRRTLAAMIEATLGLGGRGPAVLVIEDLHWADPSTLEFIEIVIESLGDRRVLLILTYRPEFEPAWQPQPWQILIQLQRLSQSEAMELIADWDVSRQLDESIRRELLQRADGVPLYLEELTRTVAVTVDSGAMPSAEVPVSLRDSLMARLDAVGSAKEVAQLGALLGRRFSFELLEAAYWRDRRDLVDKLQRLVDASLILRTGELPHATFTFKHALVQDSAYESLLRRRRAELHNRVLAALTSSATAFGDEEPETLARHCEGAERFDEAVEYYMRAGAGAAHRQAYAESLAHYRKAQALIEKVESSVARDQKESRLLYRLMTPLIARQGYASDELPPLYERLRALAGRIGGDDAELDILYSYWGFHANRNHDDIIQAGIDVLRVAERSRHPRHQAVADFAVGSNEFYSGDLVKARRLLRRAQDYFYTGPESDIRARRASDGPIFLSNLTGAWASVLSGYPEEAEATLDAVLAEFDAEANPFALVQILMHGNAVKQDWGEDPRIVLANADRMIEAIEEYNLQGWNRLAHISRGWARALLGETAGVDEIAGAVGAHEDGGLTVNHSLVMLAEAFLTVGDTDNAMDALDRCIRICDRHVSSFFLPAAHRMKAELLWQNGAVDRADQSFRTALEIAEFRNAKLLELRAATSYADFLDQTGDSDIGHVRLMRLFGVFEAGRDTPYVKEAELLLQRLHNRRPLTLESLAQRPG